MVIFSRDAVLTQRGIFGTSSFRSVNIFDKSRCWGLWLPAPDDMENSHWKLDSENHFVLSPVHTSAWPFLLRIQLFLEDREGALADAAAVLSHNGINIIISECTPAGYRHAVWAIIAYVSKTEVGDLREEKKKYDKAVAEKNSRENQEAGQKLFIRVAARMQAEAEILRMKIIDEDRKPQDPSGCSFGLGRKRSKHSPGFLRERIRDGHLVLPSHMIPRSSDPNRRKERESIENRTCALVFEHLLASSPSKSNGDQSIGNGGHKEDPILEAARRKDTKELQELLRMHQRPFAVRVSWLSRMAYYAFAGRSPHQPLSFQYSERSRSAVHDQELEQDDWYANSDLQLATSACPAIASFHTRDKYLRISPLLRNQAGYITIPYKFRRRGAPSDSSRGLLTVISRKLAEQDRAPSNFLHQTQRYTGFDGAYERGELTFLTYNRTSRAFAKVESLDASKIVEELKKIRESNKDNPDHEEQNLDLSLGKLRKRPFGVPKLFISTRFVQDDYFIDLLRKCAAASGFNPIFGETSITGAVTETVVTQVRDCDAAAFVVYSTPEELFDSDLSKLAWMQHELGMAVALGKPVAKMIDRLLEEHAAQLFPIDRDRTTRKFDRWHTSPKEMEDMLFSWMDELRQDIRLLGNK